ncbi:hypothetical protein L9F63_007715, partial [Diploptera punctata]
FGEESLCLTDPMADCSLHNIGMANGMHECESFNHPIKILWHSRNINWWLTLYPRSKFYLQYQNKFPVALAYILLL